MLEVHRAAIGHEATPRAPEPVPFSGAGLDGDYLLEAMNMIGRAALDPETWPAALDGLRILLRADVCALVCHDLRVGQGHIRQAAGISPEAQSAYGTYLARLNPWLQHEHFYALAGQVSLGSQILAHDELVKTEFYRDWLARQNLHHSLHAVVSRDKNQVTFLFAARKPSAQDFEAATVDLCRRILPQLATTERIELALDELWLGRDGLLGAVNRLPIGVMLLTVDARVMLANRPAHEIMAAADGLALGAAGLQASDVNDNTNLQRLMARAAREGRPARGAMTITRPSGAQSYMVAVLPAKSDDAPARFGPATVAMFVGDPARQVGPDPETLSRFFRLTPAEAEVTVRLAEGDTLKEVARNLNISYHTARTHLRHVFSKTGVDRQSDLIRLLWSGPALLRHP